MLPNNWKEGHTVLTLSQGNSEIPFQGRVEDKDVTLFAWQRDVLQSLAAPLFDLIDDSLITVALVQEQGQGDVDLLLEV